MHFGIIYPDKFYPSGNRCGTPYGWVKFYFLAVSRFPRDYEEIFRRVNRVLAPRGLTLNPLQNWSMDIRSFQIIDNEIRSVLDTYSIEDAPPLTELYLLVSKIE
jgi:hypothetical protein